MGVKVHFGEEDNTYYVKSELLDIVLNSQGTFIETNGLYRSPRQKTDTHIALTKQHDFTYAPIDILDDKGELVIKERTRM